MGTILWSSLLAGIVCILIVPETRNWLGEATSQHPYITGFFKFAILSTMGEFLAIRLMRKHWEWLPGFLPKILVWGCIGMLIVLMFSIFQSGVTGAYLNGLLWLPTDSWTRVLLFAFMTSTIMNLTFGTFFMALHRVSDTIINARTIGRKLSLSAAIDDIDWTEFIHFIMGKTIPFFWIPAHTITFLLPDTYKVLFAASLSIFLGLILSYAKMRPKRNP